MNKLTFSEISILRKIKSVIKVATRWGGSLKNVRIVKLFVSEFYVIETLYKCYIYLESR